MQVGKGPQNKSLQVCVGYKRRGILGRDSAERLRDFSLGS